MRTLVIAAVLGVVLQQPSFRSRVDLMRLDVSVVDGGGKPVRDLRPEDFVVTFDGRPATAGHVRAVLWSRRYASCRDRSPSLGRDQCRLGPWTRRHSRGGSREHQSGIREADLRNGIVVGLRPAGSLQFSDLIVGGRRSDGFLPATRVAEGTPVEAALELYSANPSDLDGLSVTLEARKPDDSGSLTRIAGEIRKTAFDRRRVAGAALPAASLSRGTWLISAVVRGGDAIVGRVSGTLTVE